MEIGHFTWLRTHRARYNLSSSGVMPIPLDELLKLGKQGGLIDELVGLFGVEERNIALTHGAQEGNFAALAALRELGIGKAITVIPEYEPIRALPKFLGLAQAEVEIQESLSEVMNHIEPGTALLLSNPNNPTGLYLSKKLLWELSDELGRKGSYAVLDSIFLEFVENDLKGLPLENIVYVFSTSKFYTMNELKVGWVIGDESLIKRVHEVIDLVSPLVLDLDINYASILIGNREWVRRRNMDIIMPNAETLRNLTKALGNKAKAHYSNYMPITYIEINCRGLTGTVLAEELLTKDVLVVPGKYFGKDNGVRVGLGSVRPEVFETAMKIIINVINNECRDKQNMRIPNLN